MLLEAGGAKVVYTETSDQCSQVPLYFSPLTTVMSLVKPLCLVLLHYFSTSKIC